MLLSNTKNITCSLLLSFLLCTVLYAQKKKPGLQDTPIIFRINDYAIDTVNQILYYGTSNDDSFFFNSMDARNGNSINSLNEIATGPFHGGSYINSIIWSDSVLYATGNFNYKSGPYDLFRTILAFDLQGHILPFSVGEQYSNARQIATDKNYLYVLSDDLSNAPIVINKATGDVMNDYVPIDNNSGNLLVDVAYKSGYIYVLSDQTISVYKWLNDISGNPLRLKVVTEIDLSVYGDQHDASVTPNPYNSGGGKILLINNEVYILDIFNDGITKTNILKFDWDPKTEKLTKQNYKLNLFSPFCSSTLNSKQITNRPGPTYLAASATKANTLAICNNELFVGGYKLTSSSSNSCTLNLLSSASTLTSDSSGTFTNPQLFGSINYDVRQLKIANGILYHIGARAILDLYGSATNSSNDSISANCLTPDNPGALTKSTVNVCPETKSVHYETESTPGYKYTWSYNGTGATIHSTGSNSADIDFSLKATSGNLSVIATNLCGLKSTARITHINILPVPNANAGPDVNLTCKSPSLDLTATSITSGVTYSWKKPDGSIFAGNPLTTNKKGLYIITVIDPATTCHWRDTTSVGFDTIKPVPVVPTKSLSFTCAAKTLILNGKSDAASDSLRWLDPGSVSWANPYTAASPGTYIFYAISNRNGCINSDTVHIIDSEIYPIASVPFTDSSITCKNSSVLLNGSSVTSDVRVQWIFEGDTLLNPLAAIKKGIYELLVTDMISQCHVTGIVTINDNKNKPYLFKPADPVSTCSFPSVLLNAFSPSNNTVLKWTGPLGFNSLNPAITSFVGMYVITATDTVNGCTSKDSVQLTQQPTLMIDAISDTIVCEGSTILLHATPVGGTPSFFYLWKDKTSLIDSLASPLVSPVDSTIYTITITDKNGCIGTDSILVHVPRKLTSTLKTFQPCDPGKPTGQLQIYASDGIPPYTYSIDSTDFQDSPIFKNLNLGLYTIIIKDSIGCKQITNAEISGAGLLPSPDFLVSTNNMMEDTFVVVDISNPRPDKIVWTLPADAEMTDTNMYSPTITYNKAGSFTLIMKAYYGTCEMLISKTIYFSPFDSILNVSGNNGIKDLLIYPNPSNGTFTIDLWFYKKQEFVIQVFDSKSIEQYKQIVAVTDQFTGSVTIPDVQNGTYILKITAEYDLKQKPIVVIK